MGQQDPGRSRASRGVTMSVVYSRDRSILVVVGRFPEFSQTFVVDHVRGLAERGWSVHVAARSIDLDAIEGLGTAEIRIGNVCALDAPTRREPLRRVRHGVASARVHGLSLLRSRNFRSAAYFVPSLQRLLAELRPAVVHAHFAHNGVLAAAATQGQVPVIVNFHGYDVLDLPTRADWTVYRSLLEGSHGIVHSSFLEKQVAAHLNLRLNRVRLGANHDMFQQSTRSSTWGAPLRLLTVGRLVPQKGHAVAIRALPQLARKRPEFDPFLTIVGDGPERSNLEALVSELNLTHRVHFRGALHEKAVAHEMDLSDMLIVPSIRIGEWQESFCRVAIEGLSSGLAVIGTRTGGLPETLGDGGYLVEPGDPGALASTIAALIDAASPETVCRRARQRAAQFSIERMWNDYDSVTERIRLEGLGGSDGMRDRATDDI